MARRILLSRRDFVREPSAVLSGGIWALPLSRLQDINPQVCIEAFDNRDWSATKFQVDLGFQRTVGLFFFANLRATAMGMMRLRAGTDPTFASNNYDTDIVSCWPQDSMAGGYTAWNEWTLNGVYSEEEYGALGMPRFFVPPAPIACRYILVEFQDSTSAEPLQLGCFGACETWEPPLNIQYGWSITPIDTSDVETVPFGSVSITPRGIRRRLNLGWGEMPESEFLTRQFGLALIKGRSDPIVVVPFPDTTARLEKDGVYGLVSADSQFSNPFFQVYSNTFQVDQLI